MTVHFVDLSAPGARPATAADLDQAFADVVPAALAALGVAGAAKAKIGAQNWLEAAIGGTEVLTQGQSLSASGGPGWIAATRTSDDTSSIFSQGAFAIGAFAINDNPAGNKTAYGMYIEARRAPSAGIIHGIELAIMNSGGVSQGTPHFWAQDGCSIGILLGAGRATVSPNNNPTTALVISGGDAPFSKWQTGIIFGEKSIAQNGAYIDADAVAIDMPQSYSLLWRDSADQPAAYIRSDVTASPDYHGAGGIVFTNTGIQFQSNHSAPSMALTTTGLNIGGTLEVHGATQLDALTVLSGGMKLAVPACASDAAAGAIGLTTSSVYFNTTIGALSVKL